MDSNLPDTFDIEGFNSYLQLLLQVDDIQTDEKKLLQQVLGSMHMNILPN